MTQQSLFDNRRFDSRIPLELYVSTYVLDQPQRAVAVDPWEDLRIRINAAVPAAASAGARVVILLTTLLAFGIIALAVRSLQTARVPGV